MTQVKVLQEIADERSRQDERWGGPDHDDTHTPFDWCHFISLRLSEAEVGNGEEYRRMMLEIAALATAAIESYDRKQASRA